MPIIADGGIRYSGDITKAIAAGANAVMIGGLFAGTGRKPGRSRFCTRDEHSRCIAAWVRWARWCKDRANATAKERGTKPQTSKLVPEGVEGRVPFKGPLSAFVYQLVGGLRAGMGYLRNTQRSRNCARKHDSFRSRRQRAGEPSP